MSIKIGSIKSEDNKGVAIRINGYEIEKVSPDDTIEFKDGKLYINGVEQKPNKEQEND